MPVSSVNSSISSFSTSWEPPGWLVQKVISSAGSTSEKSVASDSDASPDVSGPHAVKTRAAMLSAAVPARARLLRTWLRYFFIVLLRVLWDEIAGLLFHSTLGEACDDVSLQCCENDEHRNNNQDRPGHQDAVAAGLSFNGLQQVQSYRQGHFVW